LKKWNRFTKIQISKYQATHYNQLRMCNCSTACRRTGSTLVYTLFVRFGEECSSNLWVTTFYIIPFVNPNFSHTIDYIVNIGGRIKAERGLRIGKISAIMESREESSRNIYTCERFLTVPNKASYIHAQFGFRRRIRE